MEIIFAQHKDCKTIWMQVGVEDINCLDNSMTQVQPNTKDAALEKHVPALTYAADGLHVQIGSVAHPMLPEHFIEWILVQTKEGLLMKNLKPGDAPLAHFPTVKEADVVAVYEYCNIHGLWKK